MFFDEDAKDIPGSSFMKHGDDILSVHQVCLSDKFDKKDTAFQGDSSICDASKNDLDEPRSLFRDGFFPEGMEQPQTRFAWTEEDGIIASLVSEPGFGTSSLKDLDAALKSDLKQKSDTTTSRNGLTFTRKPYGEPNIVSSTSTGKSTAFKVDKTDPRSRCHFVKYVKKQDRTVKLWECGICGREFQHQYTLMRHLPTHTDERNFHCDECGKSFRQLSTLSQHRAIHSAERPYSCEVCKKTFNRVSTLISHRKTHSNEKPYKCHLCTKGFHQKGNLRNHLFTHTNERPYRCNICLKGFNQQSNLVCHKNKTHPEDGITTLVARRSTPRINRPSPTSKSDSSRPPISDQCEVTSSVKSFIPISGSPSSSSWSAGSEDWEVPKPFATPLDLWSPEQQQWSGVVVDQIKTYHMEVALAKKQTPFALLKPDNSSPVLVKVVDMHLPGGKQMLVLATAEDLRDGGKIIVKNGEAASNEHVEMGGAVQIRVPVVATVVPKIRPGGRLQLVVEEPHCSYHATLAFELVTTETSGSSANALPPMPALEPMVRPPPSGRNYEEEPLRGGNQITSTCTLPPPAPSPPLDLIPLDLFECIPMGPQITAVDNIEQPPHTDDIFIKHFEESIPLSDSD